MTACSLVIIKASRLQYVHTIFTKLGRYSHHYHQKLGNLYLRDGTHPSFCRTGGATARNQEVRAAGAAMPVIHDDDAKILPVSGNLDALPKQIVDQEYVSDRSELEQAGEQSAVQRILVVEDDLALASLEANILKTHGFSVVTVNSAELAIAALRRSIPDLVVLDLELTGKVSGWDVLQALRVSAAIPVLHTTSSTVTVRKYIYNQGETRETLDHLPKPYPMQTFLKRVKRMLMVAP